MTVITALTSSLMIVVAIVAVGYGLRRRNITLLEWQKLARARGLTYRPPGFVQSPQLTGVVNGS